MLSVSTRFADLVLVLALLSVNTVIAGAVLWWPSCFICEHFLHWWWC